MDIIDFLKIFENHPYLNILLYQENIIYINNTFIKLLGYSKENIPSLKPYEVILPGKAREKIKKVIYRRLKGEDFPQTYNPTLINSQNNMRIYMEFFSQTVKYNNRYAGLVIGIDVTKEVRREKLLKILKDINQAIVTKDNLNEIFQSFTKTIHKNGDYEFVCASIKEENSYQMNPKYCLGKYDEEFLEFLKTIFKASPEYIDKCIATKYMLENKFMIINNLEKFNFPNKQLINILFKQNFRSLLFFPIFKNQKLYASIGICSSFVEEFNEEVISIFQEAKQDIEYAITKIENNSFLTLLQEALKKTFAWVVITDENANIIYANESVEHISGYKISELKGKNPKIFQSGIHNKKYYKNLWNFLKQDKVFEGIMINKDKEGNLFYLKDRIIPVKTPDGKKYYISLAIDITKEKNLRNKILYLSKTDTVTNLLNRNGFIKKIEEIILPNRSYALILIDIKDFKIFNQLSGREAGDFLLKKFADLLKNIFYENDIIARIGGDEFGVFVEYHGLRELEFIIHKLLSKTKHLEFFNTHLSINIGIALYPKDSQDIGELLEKASLALDIAKTKGDYTYEYFDIEIHNQIVKYSDIKKLLRDAIEHEKFVYYFQPYVESKSFTVVGAETLIRIKDKNKLIMPNSFIDYAENSGFIKEIEKQMFPKFLDYIDNIDIPLSFNISGNSLTDKAHIEYLFKNINNKPIIIELTEREIAININYTKEIIDYFKSKNLKISIDDFGTGYSSLTYLKDLPADYIKIDMSFVKNIENSEKDLAIVETIINFAHKFNIKTIAEGVETKGQIKILKSLGCDYLQGYYFAKPMSFEELKNFLKNYKNSLDI